VRGRAVRTGWHPGDASGRQRLQRPTGWRGRPGSGRAERGERSTWRVRAGVEAGGWGVMSAYKGVKRLRDGANGRLAGRDPQGRVGIEGVWFRNGGPPLDGGGGEGRV